MYLNQRSSDELWGKCCFITIFNYRYELMPENNRTIYEGWFGAVLGLSMLISPVVGNFVMNRLPVIQNTFFQYSKFQLM